MERHRIPSDEYRLVHLREKETPPSTKAILVKKLVNGSRIGLFVDVDLFKENLVNLPTRDENGNKNSAANELKRDELVRLDLIRNEGDKSIGHLAILANALNSWARLSGRVSGFDPLTIEGVRGLIEKGKFEERVLDDEPLATVSSIVVYETRKAIEEFDALVEKK